MTAIKDPRLDIRTGLYTALSGSVSYNSVAVPVYDSEAIPEDAVKPYILIGSMTAVSDNTKQRFGFDCTLQIEAVSSSTANNPKGEKEVNTISNLIQAILMPTRTGIGFTASGFDLYSISLENVAKISIKSGVEQIVRQISRFRLKLFQQ